MTRFYAIVKGFEGDKDLFEMVGFVNNLRKRQIKILAEETQRVIRRVIQSNIKRPLSTGRLARYAGEIEFFNRGFEAGVGNLHTMDQETPYWRWQNYGVAKSGRRIPPTSIGSFSPGNSEPNIGSFRDGRFFRDSGESGGFLMAPSRPIEPMNYIETTLSTMFSKASSILARVTPRSTGILG